MTFSCIKFKRKFKMRLNSSIEESKTSLNDLSTLSRKLKHPHHSTKELRHSMIIETSTVALTKSNKLTQNTKKEDSKVDSISKKPLRTQSDLKSTEKSKLKKFFSADLNPFKIHYPQLLASPPAPPPPPPPPLPPFSSLRDLPSLTSLPSIPNSFVATSVNSATFTSTTTDSGNSHNRSSTNALITSYSESNKNSNRNSKLVEKNSNSNCKQISKMVSKVITTKVEKLNQKKSDEKLNQEQPKLNSKQIQKQRLQLYDRINLQNKLKEHTYSPLHFWNEKKVENITTNKKGNTRNLISLEQLTKPQNVNITNSNNNTNKKNLKNYISYKLKTDLKAKNKSTTNNLTATTNATSKNELKKRDSNLSARKKNKTSSVTKQLKNSESMNSKHKIHIHPNEVIKKKILDLKKSYQINEEYNYAESNKSISSNDESNTSSEEYVNNKPKEYEIKIITNTIKTVKKCEDYDDPQFPNEYDDVDENILEPIVHIIKEPQMSLKETLIAISNQQCDCKNEIKKQEVQTSKDLDDIIACTSF